MNKKIKPRTQAEIFQFEYHSVDNQNTRKVFFGKLEDVCSRLLLGLTVLFAITVEGGPRK
jgi:hypothetical protein